MSVRTARTLTFLFFVAYAVVLTWPGTIPFNRFRPQVLGLPFSFFWVALWVALGAIVLYGLHRVETRARKGG
ncbi:MAG: DUF3311 domain-containing protein [Gemmatimonadota bacterium]|jgi:TRAP-type C4-dicarboxylate transport system permease small subunit